MRSRGTLVVALLAGACGADAPAGPRIDAIEPPYGPLVGGSRIVIVGSGFAAGQAAPNRVVIGGREAPLAAFADDARLEVVIPPGDHVGAVELLVFNRHGNAVATDLFRYSAPPTITSSAPDEVLFDAATTITLTGTGFLDEGAGAPRILVDGVAIPDAVATTDTTLTFTAPPGRAFGRPQIQLANTRGIASADHGFRYIPSLHPGLLLFAQNSAVFAYFYDPSDDSIVTIPRVNPANHFTTVVRDDHGEYWAVDRSNRVGRVDLNAQQLVEPVFSQVRVPAMARVGAEHYVIDRNQIRFGRLAPETGAFTQIGTTAIPCCGSYGLASDGTTLYLVGREAGATKQIVPIDPATGTLGTPVTLTGVATVHVEEMRFFDGTLYATSRDGTLVTIDPTTGVVTPRLAFGRASAMAAYR